MDQAAQGAILNNPMVPKVNIEVAPRGSLELLSQKEVDALSKGAQRHEIQDVFRCCALAVLNTGNEIDDAAAIFDAYDDFTIEVVKRTRGLQLKIRNAPATALVDNRMVEGIRQHLFAVLRDVIYSGTEISDASRYDLKSSGGITDAVFHILNHARVMEARMKPNLVVCWGGHSINRGEYEYTKEVGYHLGLRRLDICTGCGPGAMKGPMKGAALGHAKQRVARGRFVGLSEPGIIAAEPPNPIVNHLVILPDMEKRLEAFVRLGHGIVVFPGGVGTAEEILYLMGILLDRQNVAMDLPVVFTGPDESIGYFDELDCFLRRLFGDEVSKKYKVIIGDAEEVARHMSTAIRNVHRKRRQTGDAYYFNWLMKIPHAHQMPFEVTHENVAGLRLVRNLSDRDLAVEMRRAFSALVTGNVKESGIRRIQKYGPFKLHGDRELTDALGRLLESYIEQGRMRLQGEYTPCYDVVAVS